MVQMLPGALAPLLLGHFAKDGMRFINHGSGRKAVDHVDQFAFFHLKIPRVGYYKGFVGAEVSFKGLAVE